MPPLPLSVAIQSAKSLPNWVPAVCLEIVVLSGSAFSVSVALPFSHRASSLQAVATDTDVAAVAGAFAVA